MKNKYKKQNTIIVTAKNYIFDNIRKGLINTGDIDKDIKDSIKSIQDLRQRQRQKMQWKPNPNIKKEPRKFETSIKILTDCKPEIPIKESNKKLKKGVKIKNQYIDTRNGNFVLVTHALENGLINEYKKQIQKPEPKDIYRKTLRKIQLYDTITDYK